jgi:hypothetical protein
MRNFLYQHAGNTQAGNPQGWLKQTKNIVLAAFDTLRLHGTNLGTTTVSVK